MELTGDFFRFYGEDGTVSSGVLPDSYHVLLDGDFSVELQDKYDIAGKDGKMLIGRKGFFDPALLELNVEDEIAKRGRFITSAPIPENISDASRNFPLLPVANTIFIYYTIKNPAKIQNLLHK